VNSPEKHVQLAEQEFRRLRSYLGDLPPSAWLQPSACDGWEVRDVAAHLIWVAELIRGTVSRGLQGDVSPPEGFPPARAANADSASGMFGQQAVSLRESLGDHLLPALDSANCRLNQLLGGLSAEEWDTPCYFPSSNLPAHFMARVWLKELAIHGWDIRSKLEPEAHLPPESLSVCMGGVRELSTWGFWPGPTLPTPVRYRFDVTGPVPLKLGIVIDGNSASLVPANEASPDVTLCCDSETFVLLMHGRLRFDSAIEGGRVAVQGDRGLAGQLGQWFRGL